ncbi:MAG: hypothetical protein GXO77_04780 [Calditrichaeota bacterium]|nr:hypothetical protein [Calditrichota bacterium]
MSGFNAKSAAAIMLSLWLLFSCSARFTQQAPERITLKEDALRIAAEHWLGTPYQYGGDSRRGIDCSALVRRLYKEAFGIELPRQSAAQRQLGYSVHAPYLKPGDLLFFRFSGEEGIEHVGVYLGNQQFVHASSKRGVVIDRLDDPYYKKHLVVVKRVYR